MVTHRHRKGTNLHSCGQEQLLWITESGSTLCKNIRVGFPNKDLTGRSRNRRCQWFGVDSKHFSRQDPVAAINLVETFPTLGILKEIKVEVLLLDRLTDTSTNVWLRSPTTLRHRMKLSEVHIEKRIPVPETAVDPIYIPNRTSADDLSVPREIPLNVRKILEVPGIFVSDAVVSKGLLNENPLVRWLPRSRPTETKAYVTYPDGGTARRKPDFAKRRHGRVQAKIWTNQCNTSRSCHWRIRKAANWADRCGIVAPDLCNTACLNPSWDNHG